MLILVVAAVLLAMVAYLLPQLLLAAISTTRPLPSDRQGPLPRRDLASEGSGAPSFQRIAAIEQRLCLCDVCDHAFVLSFERLLAET